jgi:NADH-ubiquinone oxidoreductase chain 2
MQYSISNLNAFIILISIGFTLYPYIKNNNNNESDNLIDKNNSPVQLINQLKGYFYINPLIALSLSITIYSFVGIPPLIGFFAKQMVLSAALDNGYIFITLIAVLTSVISAVYYLAIVKQIFFDKINYRLNPDFENLKLVGSVVNKTTTEIEEVTLNIKNIVLSNTFSITISILTLIILLFIFNPQE